ncbi:MAG: transcription antitermination protein NusB, partial [Chitinophagales bacterium]
MLSRRTIRVKVMQAVYAHEQDSEKTIDRLEKAMLENINNTIRCYLYHLFLICKTAEYIVTDVQIRSVKYIPSEEDKILSVSLFHNPVIQHLVVTENLYTEIHREKLDNRIDADYFRQFFQKLKKSEEYLTYSKKENPLLTEDKEIITFLYKNILSSEELFEQHLDDVFPAWHDDRELIFHSVMNYIMNLAPNREPFVIREARDQKELKQFGSDLLRKTILNEPETESLVASFLQHWDRERVAMLDMLLMKMSVTEWLYFPEIPVKVSINEYIDLAKRYSTPKSGEFING